MEEHADFNGAVFSYHDNILRAITVLHLTFGCSVLKGSIMARSKDSRKENGRINDQLPPDSLANRDI